MTRALVAINDGTYGGVYYSANINFATLAQPTWTRLATTGLANTSIKVMQNDFFTPYDDIYVQLDNDDVYRWDDPVWTKIMDLATAKTLSGYSGDAGYIYVDRSKAGTIWWSIGSSIGSTNGPKFLKSTDYGATWVVGATGTGGLQTADKHYLAVHGQDMAYGTSHIYRAVFISANGGSTWTERNIWSNTGDGMTLRQDTHNPGTYYYRKSATDYDLLEVKVSGWTEKQNTYNLGSDYYDRIWIDPRTDGHQRIVRCYDDKVHLFSTTDAWATLVDSTPSQLYDSASNAFRALAAANENNSYVMVGSHSIPGLAGVQRVFGMNEGDNPTTWTGIAGANHATPPYTGAIPSIQYLYVAVEGIYVGEAQASRGVYVYSVETDVSDDEHTPMWGDRSAHHTLAFPSQHAEDVEKATPTIHTPFPTGNDGYGIVEVGGNWVNSSNVIALGSDVDADINSRYLGAYNYINAGSTTYRIGLAASNDLRNWTTVTEPIIDIGAGGAFDDTHCRCPCIVTVDGILYVYYDAYSGTAWSIGLARSYDGGTTWVKYGQILAATVAWESSNICRPLVYYDVDEANAAKRWKMWFAADASGGGVGIGYAYSADGLAWTKYGSNPVIAAGGAGSWNDTYLDTGAIIKRGSTYILFYDGKHLAAWKGGYVTFTDPEGTYTQSADNPILEGDALNTAVSVNVGVGDTQITVADATIFEIGTPVWVRDASNWYLTRVVHQISGTVLEVEDAAPDAIAAATGYVTSVASGSMDFQCVIYDDGYVFFVNAHQPVGGTAILRELAMIGFSDDLASVSIDYGAGVTIHPTLTESREASVSHENLSVIDTWEMFASHEPPAPVVAGDVTGPAGATDGNFALFDGATGKLIKDGGTPTLNTLTDVDTTGTGTGDIIYNDAGTWKDYPLGIGTKVSVTSNKLRFGNSAGGNYLEIDLSTGNLRLAGSATSWDDLLFAASVTKTGATAPAYKAFGPSGSLQALMFEAGHHDEVHFEVQLPHRWKEGSKIYPHVHWTPTTADAGNVVWELEYAWANINGTFGAPSNMASDATAAGGTAWVHKMTKLKEGGNDYIDGTGKTMSSMLVCRLHRNSNAGTDTLNKDVALLDIDFHIEIDSFGSDEELVKDATAAMLLETGDYMLLETGDKMLLE